MSSKGQIRTQFLSEAIVLALLGGANAIEAQLAAGSVNPIQLVHGGVVTEAQMRAVALALDNVKRSLAS